MIRSLRARAEFAHVSDAGRRRQSGLVWIRHATAPADAVNGDRAVGYAIGRNVGGAVVRNRIRRRLRHLIDELARQGQLPCGWYVIGVRSASAASCSSSELRKNVMKVIEMIQNDSIGTS